MNVHNPYVTGNPVGFTDAFVGRVDEIEAILNVVAHDMNNGIAIYGQRRVGKTSILHRLKKILEEEQKGVKPVYFDLMGKGILSLDDVISDLAFDIADSLGIERPKKAHVQSKNFIQWLQSTINNLNFKLVLLFDEFDVFNDEQKGMAGERLFTYLNRLFNINLKKVKVVIAVGRDIRDLDKLSKTLVKNFPTIKISLLNRPHALQLIRKSKEKKYGNLVWTKQTVDAIVELTNGHSFFTQQLCSSIWYSIFNNRKKTRKRVSSKDVYDSIPDTLSHSHGAMEWIWDGLSPAQRIVVAALAGERTSSVISLEKLHEILHSSGVRAWMDRLERDPKGKLFADELIGWDILEYNRNGNGYCFMVELFRRWACENKSIARVLDELDRLDEKAHELFKKARKSYRQKNIEQAYDFVCQALERNSNHLEAIILKTKIYMEKGEENKAVGELRRLFGYLPDEARPYLVQALLALARKIDNSDEQLEIYNEVLQLDPANKRALTAKRKILQNRGDDAVEIEDYETAINAYREAGLEEKVSEIERIKALKSKLEYLENVKKEKDYGEVLIVLESLKKEYPKENDWQKEIEEYKYKNITDDEIFSILKKWKSENPEISNISLIDSKGSYSLIYPSSDPVTSQMVEFTRDLSVGFDGKNDGESQFDFNRIIFETSEGIILVVKLNHSFFLTALCSNEIILFEIIKGFHNYLEELSQKVDSIFYSDA